MKTLELTISECLRIGVVTHRGTHMEVLFDTNAVTEPMIPYHALCSMFGLPIRIIRNIEPGNTTRTEWWHNGINTNPFGDPALTIIGKNHEEAWYHDHQGRPRRKDGPAYFLRKLYDLYDEWWFDEQGLFHCEVGPARTRQTYAIVPRISYKNFCLEQRRYQDSFIPENAIINHFTVQSYIWSIHGQYRSGAAGEWAHQDDTHVGEHVIATQDGSVIRSVVCANRDLEWLTNSTIEKRHRIDGPAVIRMSNIKEVTKNGKPAPWQVETWDSQWWINGNHIPTYKIHQWAKRHGFSLRKGHPCHDRSAFTSAEAEVCFMTDFG